MVILSRLTGEQLELIKKKLGVDKIWSFSKMSTFMQCLWLYKLKYIDRIRVNGSSCYTHFGTVSHDIIQGFYDKEHEYENMVDIFNDKVTEWRIEDNPNLAFPSEKVEKGYIKNLQHYFSNVETVPYNVFNERAVIAEFKGLEKYIFQGYIDSEYIDEDGNLIIMDYKTSSISGFSGKSLFKKAMQLMTYAIGINQHGRLFNGEMKQFPLEKIILRFDMMKYCNVAYKLKNGKEKVAKAERSGWVAHIANPIRKDFEGVPKEIEKLNKSIAKLQRKMSMKKTTPEEAEGYSVEIGEIEAEIKQLETNVYDVLELNELIDEAIEENSLEKLPKFIQDKYTVTNCFIDVELNEEIVEEFKKEIVGVLDDITVKSKMDNPDEAFDRPRIDNSDSFFCVNLCEMKGKCKFYQEFKEHQNMFLDKKETMSDEDILAMIGLS